MTSDVLALRIGQSLLLIVVLLKGFCWFSGSAGATHCIDSRHRYQSHLKIPHTKLVIVDKCIWSPFVSILISLMQLETYQTRLFSLVFMTVKTVQSESGLGEDPKHCVLEDLCH